MNTEPHPFIQAYVLILVLLVPGFVASESISQPQFWMEMWLSS